jgi:dCTP deaminase
MAIKSDKWIREMSLDNNMISPYEDKQISKEKISYGLSSYGYDIRVTDEYKIFTNVNNSIIDPKKFDENSFVNFKGDVCIVPANSFALARSVEYFKIPRNVLTICLGKSTYARCGIIVNVTPFEPEWEGHVTLEISNTTPLPAKIYSNEGLCQVLFFESDEECEVSYKDKKGVTFTIIPHLAYVDFPRQMVKTFLGILKYSTLLAKAKLLAGTIQTSPLKLTNEFSSNFFGSIILLLTLVNILYSSVTLMS